MKIVVFADSHGDKESMKIFIDKLEPEMVMYLGDGIEDIRFHEKKYPNLRFEYINGNVDKAEDVPKDKLISVEGYNFYLTHGDMYGLDKHKYDTEKLVECADKKGASLLLHGHTHTPTLWIHKGITFMNPGTVRNKPGKGCSTCGLIYTHKAHFICKILFADFLPYYTNDLDLK